MITKVWALLLPAQKRAAVGLLVLMLMGMVFETMGIGLIIPALTVMTNPDIAKHPTVAAWLARWGQPTQSQLVVAGMTALVGVNALKTLFLGFLAWKQARFVFSLQASISKELFAGYLRQPYLFHLQRNSAKLINIIVTETAHFNQGGLTAALLVITELLILMGIVVLLLIVQPLGAVLVSVTLAAAGWGFHRLTKVQVQQWGADRQVHEEHRMQHLQQGLGGVKDVKLLGREAEFLAQYHVHNEGTARMGRRIFTLQALPRLWLELLAVVGLAALVLTMLAMDKPIAALVPTLGLFAVAAFRLMASANRVLQSMQNLRYYLPLINTLHAEITEIRNAPAASRVELPAARVDRNWKQLSLERVVYQYPTAPAPAVNGLSLTVARGTTVGFIGGSGTGKSTLIDVILGLLTPTQGVVRLDGVDVRDDLRGWQGQIGYVPQSIFLTDDTLRRNVAFGLPEEEIDDAAVRRALAAAQLTEFVASLPEGVGTIVGERGVRLSGGQRQRIGIARALYHDPAVLVLDEATSALDTATEKGVMEAVTALHGEKTTLIVAHRLSTVENCDRIYRLDQGRVVREGVFSEVIPQ